MQVTLTHGQFVRWRTAIFVIFAICGLGFTSWASRAPAITAALEITKSQFGGMLIANGIASIVGLSLAPIITLRLGARKSMLTGLVIASVGIVTAGVGADTVHSVPIAMAGLLLIGLGGSSCDVIMNIEGAEVEQHAGKTLLPMMHGFFSLGAFAGAGIGALAETLHFAVAEHFIIVAVLMAAIAITATLSIPKITDQEAAAETESAERVPFRQRLATSLSAWREPYIYLVGLIVLGMSFAEGGANDWLALGVTDGGRGDQAAGAIGLAIFSAAMTVARMVGGPIVDRFGRVNSLRVLAVAGAGGLLLFIFAPNLPLIYAGAFLWGIGASLGFPLGMSVAADDPRKAASRVSAVAMIGYLAFLAGPPLLGLVADHIGLLPTLGIIVGLIVVSGLASGAARERKPSPESADSDPGAREAGEASATIAD